MSDIHDIVNPNYTQEQNLELYKAAVKNNSRNLPNPHTKGKYLIEGFRREGNKNLYFFNFHKECEIMEYIINQDYDLFLEYLYSLNKEYLNWIDLAFNMVRYQSKKCLKTLTLLGWDFTGRSYCGGNTLYSIEMAFVDSAAERTINENKELLEFLLSIGFNLSKKMRKIAYGCTFDVSTTLELLNERYESHVMKFCEYIDEKEISIERITAEDEKVIETLLADYKPYLPRCLVTSIEDYFMLIINNYYKNPYSELGIIDSDQIRIRRVFDYIYKYIDYTDSNGENMPFRVARNQPYYFDILELFKNNDISLRAKNNQGLTILDKYIEFYLEDDAADIDLFEELIKFRDLGFEIKNLGLYCNMPLSRYKEIKEDFKIKCS